MSYIRSIQSSIINSLFHALREHATIIFLSFTSLHKLSLFSKIECSTPLKISKEGSFYSEPIIPKTNEILHFS